jgi:UDP-N-acetylglucosamine 2-epimerase (non-hydrolysing)
MHDASAYVAHQRRAAPEMMNLKVVFVAGTRPEILKIYPIIVELKNRGIDYLLISTGQQRDLLAQTLNSLKLNPDVDLNLMQDNQTPDQFLTSTLERLNREFATHKPSFIVVQGDTSSALAGALAGYSKKIPVGHVEAGLRSHNLYSPWPEEGFRRLIDSISTILWFPTENSMRALEGDQSGIVVGNTIVDMLRIRTVQDSVISYDENRILITLHRRESFETTLEDALRQIKLIASESSFEVIFIVHPNPNIGKMLKKIDFIGTNLKVVEPLPYLEFIDLMSKSGVVITDSGGLQEEARSLQVPLLVMRDNSERMEAIDGEMYRLTPPDGSKLREDILKVLSYGRKPTSISSKNPFGDGFSAKRIVDSIIESQKR